MFIIAWIAKSLIARGISSRLAGLLSWVITVLAVLLIIYSGWQLLKHTILSDYVQTEENNTLGHTLNSLEKADQDAAARASQAADDKTKMEDTINASVNQHPREAAHPAGPVTNDVLERMRRRSAEAQDRGRPSPKH